MASLLEHALTGLLGRSVVAETGQEPVRRLVARLASLLRHLTRLLAYGYLVILVALWLAFRFHGEHNLTLAFALYLPVAGWGMPLVLLVPLALIADWKSLVPLLASLVLLIWGFLGLRWHEPQTAPVGESVLTVLTFNRGEAGHTSLRPFKSAVKPDVLVLQEAGGRAESYRGSPGYEEFKFGDDIGEFTLVSRFPVVSKELIQDGAEAVAARFVIDWNGRSIVIYDLHMPTPRHALSSLNHGAFLWGVLGVYGRFAAKREANEVWWEQQIHHAQILLQRAESETLPCLIAGDSNAPAPGYIHHLLTQHFVDAHEAAGKGCGLSFPGTSHNPLSLGGPWLRIDKVLCNASWQPLWSQAEPDRPSQHRAVAAAFSLPVGAK